MLITTTASLRQIRVSGRAVARFVIVIVLFLAVPFVAAGTLAWPMAWAYVAVYLGSALSSRWLMLRRNPELIEERARFTELVDSEVSP